MDGHSCMIECRRLMAYIFFPGHIPCYVGDTYNLSIPISSLLRGISDNIFT